MQPRRRTLLLRVKARKTTSPRPKENNDCAFCKPAVAGIGDAGLPRSSAFANCYGGQADPATTLTRIPKRVFPRMTNKIRDRSFISPAAPRQNGEQAGPPASISPVQRRHLD